MTSVTLRFFAAARAAAGVSETTVVRDGRLAIDEALALARPEVAEPGNDYNAVMSRCSFLVDAVATTDRGLELSDGAVVDILPPFAGG